MKPEERKKLILESAKRLFSRHGFYKTQISDIIEEASIARGTFYQYFKSKEDIFKLLMESFSYDLKSVIYQDIDNSGSLSYRQLFTIRVRLIFEHFAKDPEMCSIVFRKALGLPEGLEPGILRLEMMGMEFMKKELQKAMEAGVMMHNLNIDIVSNMIAGAFSRTAYSFFSLEDHDTVSSDLPVPEGIDYLAANFVDTFIDGLAAPGISSRK